MRDYAQAKIYKLVAPGGQLYIGATTDTTLARRLAQHRQLARKGREDRLSSLMRDQGPDTFEIVLIESYPCSSNDQLSARVWYWIEKLGPTIDKTSDVIKAINLVNRWRAKATPETKTPKPKPLVHYCGCGGHYGRRYAQEHKGSQRHKSWVTRFKIVTPTYELTDQEFDSLLA